MVAMISFVESLFDGVLLAFDLSLVVFVTFEGHFLGDVVVDDVFKAILVIEKEWLFSVNIVLYV